MTVYFTYFTISQVFLMEPKVDVHMHDNLLPFFTRYLLISIQFVKINWKSLQTG